MIVLILLSLATYLFMVIVTKYKIPIAMFGLAIMLIYGTISNSIPVNSVFQRFPIEIIILIIVLALFTKKFESLGIFKHTAYYLIKVSKKNKMKTIILLVLIIYVASLFMNNLSVILLFTFICIKIAIQLELPMIPVLVSALISSNIGGAALPWSDTPAVIITLYTNFSLIDFLQFLFLPCLFYVAMLIAYLMIYSKKANNPNPNNNKRPDCITKNIRQRSRPIPPHPKHHTNLPPENSPHAMDAKDDMNPTPNRKQIIMTLVLFILLIIGICIAPFINISIALIVMLCGSVLLFLDKKNQKILLTLSQF